MMDSEHVAFRSAFMFFLFSFLALPGAVQPQTDLPPDDMLWDPSGTVFEYKRLGISIVSPNRSIEFLYFPKSAPVFLEVAELRRFSFLVNASCFHGSWLNALHAGWLKIHGKQYGPIADDRQLTHVVRVDARSKRVKFTRKDEFVPDTALSTVEFQTGPLVIENGKPSMAFIEGSINGLAKQRRTLLATLDTTQLFLVIVREMISLDELARMLPTLSVFKGKRLDVVNLDGGSSTALYSRNFPRLNFNVNDRLPLLIGVR